MRARRVLVSVCALTVANAVFLGVAPSASASGGEARVTIKRVFKSKAKKATRVGMCLSGLKKNAHGPHGGMGYFQLTPETWRKYGRGNPYDGVANTKAAYRLYKEHGWKKSVWGDCSRA